MEKNSLLFKFFSLYYGGFEAKTQHKNLLNIKHVVPTVVVVLAPAVIGVVSFVPAIREALRGLGLLAVDPG